MQQGSRGKSVQQLSGMTGGIPVSGVEREYVQEVQGGVQTEGESGGIYGNCMRYI